MWWQWVIFALLLVAIPFALGYFALWIKRKKNITEEQNKILSMNIARYVLFYWLCDLFYMSFIINSLACRYVFGGLIMTIIFYNIASVFVNQSATNGNSLVKVGIIQDLIVGVGISVYLIYLIPNATLQQIVIAIVAALYGGLFTLVGVAWTIRKGDADRKSDLERITLERKEDERKMYRPVFSVANYLADKNKCVRILLDDLLNIDTILTKKKTKTTIDLQAIIIENSSKVEFYVTGLKFDGVYYPAKTKSLVKKDYSLCAYFYEIYAFMSTPTISLCIEDLISNKYDVELQTEIKDNKISVIEIQQIHLIEK